MAKFLFPENPRETRPVLSSERKPEILLVSILKEKDRKPILILFSEGNPAINPGIYAGVEIIRAVRL